MEFVVSHSDDAPAFTLTGSSFSVVLDGNPTTGYEWMLDPLDADTASAVTLTGDVYAANAQPQLVGGGGTHKFSFAVNDAPARRTALKLKFLYKRVWEADPVRTVPVVINRE
ncbi:hypothetical protein HDU77_004891 [Chytriomyces hyalinus]|nr:hypothetical protein HDU77_004891 [Chytriomyces hyalinus]